MFPKDTAEPLLGGIAHLNTTMQDMIKNTQIVPEHKCCSDPNWLYHIFADTTVNIEEITVLIDAGVVQSKALVESLNFTEVEKSHLLPSLINDIVCLQADDRQPGDLWIEWQAPWNEAAVDHYNIKILNNDKLYNSHSTATSVAGFIPGTEVKFQVRAMIGSYQGEFGMTVICTV